MRYLQFAIFLFLFNYNYAQQNLVKYVKPIIGTEKMGHTYPGATVPFGAVQLSPKTDTISYELNGKYNGEVYKYCAGYKYENKIIQII
jgi:putative alpha-1,2-mannosidase